MHHGITENLQKVMNICHEHYFFDALCSGACMFLCVCCSHDVLSHTAALVLVLEKHYISSIYYYWSSYSLRKLHGALCNVLSFYVHLMFWIRFLLVPCTGEGRLSILPGFKNDKVFNLEFCKIKKQQQINKN